MGSRYLLVLVSSSLYFSPCLAENSLGDIEYIVKSSTERRELKPALIDRPGCKEALEQRERKIEAETLEESLDTLGRDALAAYRGLLVAGSSAIPAAAPLPPTADRLGVEMVLLNPRLERLGRGFGELAEAERGKIIASWLSIYLDRYLAQKSKGVESSPESIRPVSNLDDCSGLSFYPDPNTNGDIDTNRLAVLTLLTVAAKWPASALRESVQSVVNVALQEKQDAYENRAQATTMSMAGLYNRRILAAAIVANFSSSPDAKHPTEVDKALLVPEKIATKSGEELFFPVALPLNDADFDAIVKSVQQ